MPSFLKLPFLPGVLLAGCLVSLPAHAEKADRQQPLSIEADKPGTVDLQKQLVIFNGNVVISQGSLRFRADHVEVRESSDGWRNASATGGEGRQATFSQKRDGVAETIEGAADRIEYDERTDTVRLIGHATIKRLRDGNVADQVEGALITWDNLSELFTVQGGAATPGNPSGRVRAVLTPPQRQTAPASASSASSAAGITTLKNATRLGKPK